MACNSKTACRRAKPIEIWDRLGVLVENISDTFWPRSGHGPFWSHSVHFFEMVCTLKTTGCSANRIEIWDLGVSSATYYMGNYDRNLGIILCTYVKYQNGCQIYQKRLAVERNWLEFGTRGPWLNNIPGTFDLTAFNLICPLVHLPQNACDLKLTGLTSKVEWYFELKDTNNTCMGYI